MVIKISSDYIVHNFCKDCYLVKLVKHCKSISIEFINDKVFIYPSASPIPNLHLVQNSTLYKCRLVKISNIDNNGKNGLVIENNELRFVKKFGKTRIAYRVEVGEPVFTCEKLNQCLKKLLT